MKISVVITCFNSERTVGSTLESVFAQDHRNWEIVIVDGNSSDSTLKIVQSFPTDKMIVLSEPDRGIYDAMNKGLSLFTGDCLGFLNSDDRFHDSRVLSRIAAELRAADMVHGDVDFIENHTSNKVVRRWRGSPYRRNAFRTGWMPAHPSLYCRRHVIEAVGAFDLSYGTASDYDWMLRAFERHGLQSTYIGDVLVDMQIGGASTAGASAYILGNLQALRSRRVHLGSGMVDLALFVKPLRKIGQFASMLGAGQ